jgi:Fe-S oxidoreductase
MPAFAIEPFWRWHRNRNASQSGKPIILFVDTFNNYFRPQTAIAATEVLERAGYRVIIPERPMCCGRPLFDWGMLETAKSLLKRILHQLEPEIANGTPMVGLEPACTATFRDELVNLFPENPLARRLSHQTLLFSEFIDQHANEFALEPVNATAIVQIHCHHHSIMKDTADRRVLDRLGLDYEIMPSGCCGMAGSFGFERDKYELSMKAAERVMLPKVRAAASDTLVLANGFSCREQIEQATSRTTLHLAELMARQSDLNHQA